jgi:hypothetical protein
MFIAVQYHPAVPEILEIRVVAPTSVSSAALAPRAVVNAPITRNIQMAGRHCYGRDEIQAIGNVMTKKERDFIQRDYGMHGSRLNRQDLVVRASPEQADAHVFYRALCTMFESPGRFCIRHSDDGGFALVHRSQSGQDGPQLVRTPLHFSAKGWELRVARTARKEWDGVRDRYFPMLDALKAALPGGMKEVEAVSVGASNPSSAAPAANPAIV